MRVAVIGAGISGLAAARTLVESGHEACVFEQSDRVGGRARTDRFEGYVFDSGATSIAPRGRSLDARMKSLNQEGLVKIKDPIFIHQSMRIEHGDPDRMVIERFTYEQGNDRLATLLADGLDVRLNSPIREARREGNTFRVLEETFEAVIVATIPSDSAGILKSLGVEKPVGHIFYRSCLSVMLGIADELADQPYHALIEPEQRHPLTWLSLESQKCAGRAPEGCTALVAQMSPEYSRQRFEYAEADIVQDALFYINRLLGKSWSDLEVARVHRWKASQPESLAMFDRVNTAGDRVVLASDSLLGGRIEYAYETGVMAAGIVSSA